MLFPAIWVQPVYILSKLYSAIFKAVGNDIRGEQITGLFALFYYFIVLTMRMSVVTLGVLAGAAIGYKSLSGGKHAKYLVWIVAYFVSYYVVLTVSDQKIDRYSLAMFLSPYSDCCSIYFYTRCAAFQNSCRVVLGILLFLLLQLMRQFTPLTFLRCLEA